jgi:hypothetical protein
MMRTESKARKTWLELARLETVGLLETSPLGSMVERVVTYNIYTGLTQ